MYIPTYTYMKSSFEITILELGIARSFSDMALNVFCKRALHIYININKN